MKKKNTILQNEKEKKSFLVFFLFRVVINSKSNNNKTKRREGCDKNLRTNGFNAYDFIFFTLSLSLGNYLYVYNISIGYDASLIMFSVNIT